jgi:hypothetical protein
LSAILKSSKERRKQMFNFFKKNVPLVEVIHYSVHFKTIDGNKHSYTHFRYADPTQLNCSIPEYLMCLVKSDGYFADDDGLMYPLQNVVQIEWEEDSRQTVVQRDRWNVFY